MIVASVSCIYGLGSPEAYYGMMLFLEKGQKIKRDDITRKLVEILYERTDGEFRRGTFRVRGDVIEIFPTYDDIGVSHRDVGAMRSNRWRKSIPCSARSSRSYVRLPIYPKTHYVMKPETKATRGRRRSWKNWRGGRRNSRSREASWRRSAFISARASISK